jgi:hypothetical protein
MCMLYPYVRRLVSLIISSLALNLFIWLLCIYLICPTSGVYSQRIIPLEEWQAVLQMEYVTAISKRRIVLRVAWPQDLNAEILAADQATIILDDNLHDPEAWLDGVEYYVDDSWGWPLPIVWGRVGLDVNGCPIGNIEDGIKVIGGEPSLLFSKNRPMLLPYRLQWPGIIVDAVIGVVVLLGLHKVYIVIVRRWRRKHGRCEACSYLLTGVKVRGCPECGWGREKKLDQAPVKS